MKGLRIGIPMSYFTDDMDPGVGAALTESLKALESLGCEIVPVTLPAEMTAVDVAGDAHHRRGGVRPTTATGCARGRRTTRRRCARGSSAGSRCRRRATSTRCACAGQRSTAFTKSVFAKVDVLHAPCLPIPTPTIAETDVGGSPGDGPHARCC